MTYGSGDEWDEFLWFDSNLCLMFMKKRNSGRTNSGDKELMGNILNFATF
jgi:hypothetical protein